jgi:NADH:ubiquinone oxidoreductase subunit E
MTATAAAMELGAALGTEGAGAASGEPSHRLRCCDASACRNAGGIALRQALLAARAAAGLGEHTLAIRAVGCLRLCGRGPLVAADGPGG